MISLPDFFRSATELVQGILHHFGSLMLQKQQTNQMNFYGDATERSVVKAWYATNEEEDWVISLVS